MTHPYVVCSTPRSGSSLLCTALEATGHLGTSREYFSRASVHHHAVAWGVAGPGSTSTAPVVTEPARYLSRVHAEVFGGRHAGGHKIHWYQLELARSLGLIQGVRDVVPPDASSPRLLRTRRRDVVAQAVSAHIADTTRIYYQWSGRAAEVAEGYERAQVRPPHYDFAEIHRRVREVEAHERHWDAEVAASGLEHHLFWYEDLAGDYEPQLRRALRVVGVSEDVQVPPPQLVRQASPLNREMTEQYRYDSARSRADRDGGDAVLGRG